MNGKFRVTFWPLTGKYNYYTYSPWIHEFHYSDNREEQEEKASKFYKLISDLFEAKLEEIKDGTNYISR